MGVLKETQCQYYSPSLKTFGNTYPKTDCISRIDDGDKPGFCKNPNNYRCVKEAGLMKLPLSYSTAGDFLTCPFLYYLKNIRGIRINNASTSKALKMGKLWDAAKQNILKDGSVDLAKIVEEYEIGSMEIAKVRALYRAYKALGIKTDDGFELQSRFSKEIEVPGVVNGTINKVLVSGAYDRKYKDHFVEEKLSSSPDFYLDIFSIQSQVGAYFLADSAMEYCIMEVVRTPALKSTSKYKEESPEEHENRTYSDIISRPSFYFIGYDKEKGTYGKKYFRNEFNLDEIISRFKIIEIMISDCAGFDSWYKNDKSCSGGPWPCEMKPICRYNTMSEEVYKIMSKPKF